MHEDEESESAAKSACLSEEPCVSAAIPSHRGTCSHCRKHTLTGEPAHTAAHLQRPSVVDLRTCEDNAKYMRYLCTVHLDWWVLCLFRGEALTSHEHGAKQLDSIATLPTFLLQQRSLRGFVILLQEVLKVVKVYVNSDDLRSSCSCQ